AVDDGLLLGGPPGRGGDDQRRLGLVNEDVVGLVHQGEVVLALHLGVQRLVELAVGGPRLPERHGLAGGAADLEGGGGGIEGGSRRGARSGGRAGRPAARLGAQS